MIEVKRECSGQIALLNINRPEARNALSLSLVKELNDIVFALKEETSLRALVITGEGEKAFSAGADLKERSNMTEEEALHFVETIQGTFQKLAELPVPTIAAINGDAFGGGLELALACDMRAISEHALIGLTECSLGIIPGAGGTQRLPRLVGPSRAMEFIFMAKRLDAKEAIEFGLANWLFKNAAETKEHALILAETIARNAPLAVRAAKEAIKASLRKDLVSGLVFEMQAYHGILHTKDRIEGLKAFKEKRHPLFLGL